MNRLALLAGLALAAAATPVMAQTCQGYTSFSVAPLRVTGDLLFGDDATQFGASLAGGQSVPGLFGGVAVSGTRFDGTDETAKSLGVFGGFSVPVTTIPGLEFCPVADFSHTWFPGDFSANNFSIGGAFGRSIAATPTLNLVPFADLRFTHVSLSDDAGSDSAGQLGLGAGLVFSRNFTVRPALLIPIAQDGASTAFGVSVGFNFGGK